MSFGQQLLEELKKEDFITEEESNIIEDDCKEKYGAKHVAFEQIGEVLVKIYKEVN